MDRLLYTALFAVLAGFLTAALSFVKLVNDKEGKISDFREQWTQSAREALAELISKITSVCQIVEERAYRSDRCNEIVEQYQKANSKQEKDILQEMLSYERSTLEKTNETRRQLIIEIHNANYLARLHFKINDPNFIAVEHKVDASLELLRSTEDDEIVTDEKRVKDITSRVAVLCADILSLSRIAIKHEWEKVKQGEPIYKKTKNAAKWGGVFFLFVFITVGIHAFITSHNLKVKSNQLITDTKNEMVGDVNHSKISKPIDQIGSKNIPAKLDQQ